MYRSRKMTRLIFCISQECLKVATSQIQIDIQYVFFKQVCEFHQIIYDFQIDFCTVNANIGHILAMRAVIPNTLHLKRYNTCN